MRQGTVFVQVQRLVEFGEGRRQISLLLQRLSPKNGRAQSYVARVGQNAMIRIDRNSPRTSERFDRERRVRAHHFNPLVLGLPIGINSEIDRHAEQVQVLRDFSRHPEARRLLLFRILRRHRSTQPVRRVFHLEFRSSRRVQPLREEPGQLAAIILLRNFAEVIRGRRFSSVLRGELPHSLVELVFPENPAQHVQDHRAFIRDQRLELGRKNIQLARAGKRNRVIGQRAH